MTATLVALPPVAGDVGEHRSPDRSVHERRHLTERILALLARGAGVWQILAHVPPSGATAAERLGVGSQLRGILASALQTGHAPAGVKNTRRDLERTIEYLDTRLVALAEIVAPERSADILWAPLKAMASDHYGAEIDVRDGPPSLTVLDHAGEEKHEIRAVLLHILGEQRPDRLVTVNLPAGWTPGMEQMTTLAQAIYDTHLSH